jgi:hypothetical protein
MDLLYYASKIFCIFNLVISGVWFTTANRKGTFNKAYIGVKECVELRNFTYTDVRVSEMLNRDRFQRTMSA